MKESMFEQLDFGAFKEYIDNDDITDISYTNNGQIWVRSLEKGSYRVENPKINNAVVEKLAFQCSNVMGTTFNNASPFLDAESPELRLNFVHESIATNGIALVIRKTPAKIRLKEENLLKEDYVTKDILDFLIKCVHGHCNIMVCGETGSGKTEFVKYLASHTKENEKIITIEDTLELHLDRIYPHRDIVAMKTNNIASYSDVLVTCMRQNPKWILLSEVRSAEAVTAVRNSISSGHNILSTIHSDKASAIPHRLYSLMETDLDVDQFLNTIYRYIQIGVHIKAYYSKKYGKFHREIDEITEFYIDEETNKPIYNTIYQKNMMGKVEKKKPSQHLLDYLLGQNINLDTDETDDADTENAVKIEEEPKLDLDKMVEEDNQKVNISDQETSGLEISRASEISNFNKVNHVIDSDNPEVKSDPIVTSEIPNIINPNSQLVDIDNIQAPEQPVPTIETFNIPRPEIPVESTSNELVFEKQPVDNNMETTIDQKPNIGNVSRDFLLSSKNENQNSQPDMSQTSSRFFPLDSFMNQSN